MNHYCMYLRKSRRDIEAETYGSGETFSSHEKQLTELANRLGIRVDKIYKEIVSGDTIAARPQMQQLLQDIENGMWQGVLVTEVERLARGATIDQGIISQVFSLSHCKIITLSKTYDPDNEFDEEFFEYGLFQSRREYKAINRRQQRGIQQSVRDGKWVYNKVPFGYRRIKLENQKGYTLEVVPEEAELVKFIYDTYEQKKAGYTVIAEKLTEMGVPARYNDHWSLSTVKDILTNPVYIGQVRRGYKKTEKRTQNGELISSRPRRSYGEYDVFPGLHQAIISEEQFLRVQEMFASHPSHPVGKKLEIKFPAAGLVYCKLCGSKMVRRPNDKAATLIMCRNKQCPNIAGDEEAIVNKILESLRDYLEELKTNNITVKQTSKKSSIEKSLEKLNTEQEKLTQQLDRAYELVEQEVYTIELFQERSQKIKADILSVNEKIAALQTELDKESKLVELRESYIPRLENVLDIWDTVSPAEQNKLLYDVVDRIEYLKTVRSRKGPKDNFELDISPRIPL